MKQSSQLGQEGQTMQPAAPQHSCSNDRELDLQGIHHKAGSASNALVFQDTPHDATTHTRPNSTHAHGYTPTSTDVHSLDEQVSLLLMRGEGGSNAAVLEQKEKALQNEELEREMDKASEKQGKSDYTTDTCASSLKDSSQSSISLAKTKSKSNSRKPTNKSTGSHPYQTSVSSPNNYSSSSSNSTELLYRALKNDRALNDFSSSSTETDQQLTSSQDDKKPRSNSQDSTTQNEPNRKRKILHPTAQDSSVSSLGNDSCSSFAGLGHAEYDSSSSSTGHCSGCE